MQSEPNENFQRAPKGIKGIWGIWGLLAHPASAGKFLGAGGGYLPITTGISLFSLAWLFPHTQNGTFSEFCILSRHLDRFCSSKRPRGPRGPPELPNDKKTAAPRLLDRLLFRYPPPQIRLKWDVLSVTFNGKFQR